MATAAFLVPERTARPTFEPIIQEATLDVQSTETFNPEKHVNFIPPSKVYTMQDIGLPENTGVSPVAVSEPFTLFTAEAIHRMRAEVLSEAVWDNCQYSSNLAQCQLRGFAPQ